VTVEGLFIVDCSVVISEGFWLAL